MPGAMGDNAKDCSVTTFRVAVSATTAGAQAMKNALQPWLRLAEWV